MDVLFTYSLMNCAIFFLQDFKVEDVILELRDGKDFNAIFILGEKSFRVHLGMVLFAFLLIKSSLNDYLADVC